MKTADMARFMGPDERKRMISAIAQMHQPSFVVGALVEHLRDLAERDKDEQLLHWINELRSLEDEMKGMLR